MNNLKLKKVKLYILLLVTMAFFAGVCINEGFAATECKFTKVQSIKGAKGDKGKTEGVPVYHNPKGIYDNRDFNFLQFRMVVKEGYGDYNMKVRFYLNNNFVAKNDYTTKGKGRTQWWTWGRGHHENYFPTGNWTVKFYLNDGLVSTENVTVIGEKQKIDRIELIKYGIYTKGKPSRVTKIDKESEGRVKDSKNVSKKYKSDQIGFSKFADEVTYDARTMDEISFGVQLRIYGTPGVVYKLVRSGVVRTKEGLRERYHTKKISWNRSTQEKRRLGKTDWTFSGMTIDKNDTEEYPKALSGQYTFEYYDMDGNLLMIKHFKVKVIDRDGYIME